MKPGIDRRTILVAEDDAEVRDYLAITLRCHGYDVHLSMDGEGILNHLKAGRPASLIVLDIIMPNKDGWETLGNIRQMGLSVPVIMLSGMSSPPSIVQAIKGGAVDFLAKPVNHEDLVRAIERAFVPREDQVSPERATSSFEDGMFFGNNTSMNSLRSCMPRVALSDAPVLIQGETGTGKEVLARRLHQMSSRARQPFVKLNCAAVPSELIESELFGYERGAFTGAIQKKAGLFELADGGTILLDEIGDMDVRLQAKLLQVLQDQAFRRVGGTEVVRVDVRVIAATHRDLLRAMREGTFREDLYYRLNIFTLSLPSLRERREDILRLAEFLIRRHSSPGTPPTVLTQELRNALQVFSWPGNVRQLENIVRKLIVLRDPDVIVRELETISNRKGVLEVPMSTTNESRDTKPLIEPESMLRQASRIKEEAEAEAILKVLQSSRWNRKQAAALLKIEYKTLLYKMKKLSIEERASKISLSA